MFCFRKQNKKIDNKFDAFPEPITYLLVNFILQKPHTVIPILKTNKYLT